MGSLVPKLHPLMWKMVWWQYWVLCWLCQVSSIHFWTSQWKSPITPFMRYTIPQWLAPAKVVFHHCKSVPLSTVYIWDLDSVFTWVYSAQMVTKNKMLLCITCKKTSDIWGRIAFNTMSLTSVCLCYHWTITTPCQLSDMPIVSLATVTFLILSEDI